MLHFPEISLDQINWLRYKLENECKGDETRRRREYPSTPEEAFEAASATVLDPSVLARWLKESRNAPFVRANMLGRELSPGQFMVTYDADDRFGVCLLFPHENAKGDRVLVDPHQRYVIGVDCASGVSGEEHDWHAATVLSVETGLQVATFHSQQDPDEAADQVEGLAVFFNNAFTGVEITGGYGTAFLNHLIDRRTVPLYERERFDKGTRKYMKQPGWSTDTKTRPPLIAEMKYAVRNETIHLVDTVTVRECQTLWRNPKTGKIQAREGKHDDKAFSAMIANWMRTYVLRNELAKAEEERAAHSIVQHLNRLDRLQHKSRTIDLRIPKVAKPKFARPVPKRVDGRRSTV